MSPRIQIKIADAQRAHCEITPFPSEAAVHAALSAPLLTDRERWAYGRETAYNSGLVNCSLRGDALVHAIDDANKALNALADAK